MTIPRGARTPTTPRSRVETVLAGKAPDQTPISFWLHNFAREQTVDALVAETLRLQETFEFDLVKPQSPAHAACLTWGAEVTVPQQPDVWPVLVRPVVRTAADLHSIKAMPVSGQLADQIEVLRCLRKSLGPDVPLIGTIFAPLMVLWFMHEGGKPAVLELVRENPEALTSALDGIAETLCEFATALVEEAGVDGVFYATTTCCKGELSERQHELHHAPYDREILAACAGARMNILHLCGHEIEARRFVECEAPIVSWELGGRNPNLIEMHAMFARTMMTGVSGKPAFGTEPVSSLRRQARAAIDETGGRNLILAPGCSINPGVDEARIGAVIDEVRTAETRQDKILPG